MPPDHFALLGKPRRPWLDPDELRESFHRLTALTHPDRHPDGDSAGVNAAYAALREPASRLRCLLELEYPELLAEAPEVPPALAEIFMRLATLRRAVDAFVEQESQASLPLTQALLASERFTLLRDVKKELAALEATKEGALEQMRLLDAGWEVRDAALARQAAELQQALSYYSKWEGQLREALFSLESGGTGEAA